ncbi:MAG: 2OG-Fe(II) oxygenase [Bacteroidota bacterium]
MNSAIILGDEQMDLLAQQDYLLLENFFADPILAQIEQFFEVVRMSGTLEKASIGATGREKVISEIRGDHIYWLEKERDRAKLPIFDQIDALMATINRSFFLSLSDYEFHLALYPPGTYYKKHLDQFKGRNNRMISMIIYLNEEWKPGHGGELKIYPTQTDPVLIAPLYNRCVLFRSDVLYHEVLLAQKPRRSITGWMLYQPSPLAAIPGV